VGIAHLHFQTLTTVACPLGKVIETGAFELAKDSLTASEQLLARFPDAQSSSRLTAKITDN
jgi:hypothetical protein